MRKLGWIALLAILLVVPTLASATQMYTVPDAMPMSTACRVWLDGEETVVMDTAVNLLRTWTSRPATTTTPLVRFGWEEVVEVQVQFVNQEIQSAVVRPLSLGIEPSVNGDVVTFQLQQPTQLTVEINGEQAGALHVFADSVSYTVPSGDNVIVYAAGLHDIGTVTLTDGQTVYLMPGAVVRGQFVADGADAITIAGYGILDGSAFHRWEQQTVPIDLSHCTNVHIEGITILDPAAWTINLYHCASVSITDVKIIGARSNSDGISVQSCENVAVDRCFIRGWDDNLVVKGYDGDARNISFTNCILWTDLAQSCEIGYETRADVIENITFENITVLHANHKPVLSIHNSDSALIRNIVFRNIIVEDCNLGQGDGTEFLIDFTTTKSQWSQTTDRGNIQDVLVENVTVLAGKVPSVRIFAFDKEHTIDNVTIRNLTLMGETIQSFDALRFTENKRSNGTNIVIE